MTKHSMVMVVLAPKLNRSHTKLQKHHYQRLTGKETKDCMGIDLRSKVAFRLTNIRTIFIFAAIVRSLQVPILPTRHLTLRSLLSNQREMSRSKKIKKVVCVMNQFEQEQEKASFAEESTPIPLRRSKRKLQTDAAQLTSEVQMEDVNIVTPEKLEQETPQKAKRKSVKQATEVVARSIEITSTAFPSSSATLLTIDVLHRCRIIARPSKTIKSPYVADIEVNEATLDSNGISIMAHAPGLDCTGIVVSGAHVFCSKNAAHKSAKTSYAIQLCEEVREDNSLTTIGYHPQLAETLSREIIANHHLTDVLGEYTSYRSQETIGDSRLDFVLNHTDGSRRAMEVKNVVATEYDRDLLPADRVRKMMFYRQRDIDYDLISTYPTSSLCADGRIGSFQRAALFPVGAKKAKVGVVSTRAIKHINNLIQLVDGQLIADDSATAWRATILFIINRSDCDAFRPCHEVDHLFAQMIRRAAEHGVQVIAQEIVWNPQLGQAQLGRLLPVILPRTIRSEDIDEEQLQRVLEFVPPPDSRKA